MEYTPFSKSSHLLCLLVAARLISSSVAFLGVDPGQVHARSLRHASQHEGLNLVPLSTFSDRMSLFSDSDEQRGCLDSNGCFQDGDDIYELALVEAEDLPDLCRFIVSAFGAASIRFSQDLNSFEQLLLNPAAELVNSYSFIVAFAEVLTGTRQRLATRLEKMDISPPALDHSLTRQDNIYIVEKDSLILALVKKGVEPLEVIGTIELRLQV
jgi:hypothetical protein